MKIGGKEMDFPASSELRFDTLFEAIGKQAETACEKEKAYLLDLLDRAEVLKAPKGVSKAMQKKHSRLIDELMHIIIPPALTTNEIKSVIAPWQLEPVGASERFRGIMSRAGDGFELSYSGFDDDLLYMAACAYIMAMHYGYPSPVYRPFYFEIPNVETGKVHSYRLASNVDHVRVLPTSRAKEIDRETYHLLMDNFGDIDLWKKYFPKNSWVFAGFNIMNLMDLTADQLTAAFTQHLLIGNTSNDWSIKKDLSEMLNAPILLSFLAIKGDELHQNRGRDITPMILGGEEGALAVEVLGSDLHRMLFEEGEHVAIANVKKEAGVSGLRALKRMYKKGIKSYYAAPVFFQNELMGIMEVGSAEKGVLTSARRIQFDQVLPIIGIAGKRFMEEHENRVEAIIQSAFTTIHPSVKWKFEKEAEEVIVAGYEDRDHEIGAIVFDEVYPLFGQLDIRNSSVTRNEGIRKDLQTQLQLALDVIQQAKNVRSLPAYDELYGLLQSSHLQLEHDIVSSSEQQILQLLASEFHPILDHFSSLSTEVSQACEHYNGAIDPDHGFVYQERASFDTAVNTLNRVLSKYMDDKQEQAQEMFPHYFERYTTDGLEFNMYIGESIAPGKGFHPIMVKNLRLWQLMVMVELEREYDQVKRTLEKPLSVAALVLAHSTPMAIRYRMDEKQFDVDGAYNVRYEIIKKRIDKAHVKGTDERITQPGKMVVVYSTEGDEREYLRYFRYLQNEGYLEAGDIEFLVLEDLQGVSGLKALRLGIDYRTELNEGMTIEEIVESMETGSPEL